MLFQVTWTQTLKCNNIRTKILSSAVASEEDMVTLCTIWSFLKVVNLLAKYIQI